MHAVFLSDCTWIARNLFLNLRSIQVTNYVLFADVPGIKLFGFHGNVNEELNGRESGRLSRDVLRQRNGRWTYWNPNVKLKANDVINYWIYVDFERNGQTFSNIKDSQKFTVTGENISTSIVSSKFFFPCSISLNH